MEGALFFTYSTEKLVGGRLIKRPKQSKSSIPWLCVLSIPTKTDNNKDHSHIYHVISPTVTTPSLTIDNLVNG